MVMHHFLEEEANTVVDEDEQLAILACLLELQVNR
jgi:hypothetical protein